MSQRESQYREYVNEEALRAELTLVNLKEEYKKANKPETIEKFNARKNARIDEIKEFLKQNSDSLGENDKKYFTEEIQRLEELTIEKQTKERMGSYVLLITNNLAKKSCFAGYTLNWKDEFFSRAIEHCFKYIHNFDENKVSPRSGKKVKAFAYLTQIIYTAFLDVISKRKKEQERLKMMGTMSDLAKDESGAVIIEKKSKYKNSILLEFDVLNETDLNNELQNLIRFKEVRDSLNILKGEIFLLSQYAGDKDAEYIKEEQAIFSEYDRLSNELGYFKEKYKMTIRPEVIRITCNEYGDVKLSEVLNKFQFDNMSCVITKNKTPKKIESNSISDF